MSVHVIKHLSTRAKKRLDVSYKTQRTKLLIKRLDMKFRQMSFMESSVETT